MSTRVGDLTLANDLFCANTSATAVILNAGLDTAAGTADGGNIIISGAPQILSGRALFYTGSVNGSTGLTDFIGSGTGRFRYNSDETATNYTAPLGGGLYAIYREKPTFTVTTGNQEITYGDALSFTSTITGSYVNGDTDVDRSGSPTWAVSGTPSDSGLVAAGDHTVTYNNGYASAYGYSYTAGAAANLTVNKKALTITANNDSKFVGRADAVGYNGVSYNGFVNGETASGLPVGEFTAPSISRTNAGVNTAGEYLGVLKPEGAAASNYSLPYANGNYTIIPAKELQIKVNNANVTYGSAPSYSINSVQYVLGDSGDPVSLDLDSQTGNTYTYKDGNSGTVTFTLTPTGAATSTSGNIKTGNYEMTVTGFSKTTGNLDSDTAVVSGALSVAQKALTASVTGGLTKTYDATKDMTGLTLGLTGTITNDLVSAGGTGEYKQANAGNNLDYTVDVTLAGADHPNYFLNSATLNGANGSYPPSPDHRRHNRRRQGL